MPDETEIKLALPASLIEIRRKLRNQRFKVSKRRVHEVNAVFDTRDVALRQTGRLLRLRQVADRNVLTYKGPPQDGPHKRREELEIEISDRRTFEKIVEQLGYTPMFRYEKLRTEYERAGEHGVVTLDETPIGNFLEIEGRPRWIDRSAKELGFNRRDYITKSYGTLYNDYCAARGIQPTDMLFRPQVKR